MLADHQTIKALPRWLLFCIVFIAGASVLVIEIIGTRVLSPFFGSGIYTWTALITTALAALALGYIVGGKLADRQPQSNLLFYICSAAAFWTIITPRLAIAVLPEFVYFTDMRVAIFVASFLLFFPNLFFLGAVGPFCIRLITSSNNEIGSNSGLIFAVSTLGSLLAAVASGFILIPNFGVNLIFSVCGLVLLLIAVIGLLYIKRFRSATAISVLFCLLVYFIGIKSLPKSEDLVLLDSESSFYGQVQVIEKSGYKALLVDGVGQNYVADDDYYAASYIQFIALLPQFRLSAEPINTALVIGLGAGELPMLLQQDNITVETVEINPVVKRMAEDYFDFKLASEQVYIEDGRYFLNKSKKFYDLIVLDAFNSDQVAWHLLSTEALASAKNRLTDTGLLVINITSIAGNDDIASLYATLKNEFNDVRIYSEGLVDGLSSFVFVTSARDIAYSADDTRWSENQREVLSMFINGEKTKLKEKAVITDDFNPVSFQRRQIQILWRSEMRDYLGTDQLALLFN